ncbi:MAG: hypothetical protein ER33_14610 [Cyanobium sp. CACIAM 14]|nr:MAG: hypothetical protein ER33_14610 [Cyanobium sp. CACIAM 14]
MGTGQLKLGSQPSEEPATDDARTTPAARFRVYGDLNDFLPPHRRQREFLHPVQEHATVKDTVEAIGVPHPEIGLILIDGTSVGFGQRVPARSRVSVYPQFSGIDITAVSRVLPPPLEDIRFVLDVHLGKLATYLRLLGFDVLYRNDSSDDALAALAARERRILLSNDRGLLKRRAVTHGAMVRAADPRRQLREVVRRFRLSGALRPLTRCPRCNGVLQPVAKREVERELPPYTRLSHAEFRRCPECRQIYWQGAHAAGLCSLLQSIGVDPDRRPQDGGH